MLKKTLVVFIVFSLALILLPQIVNAKRVRVKGYYRKDGTYVSSYYRTSPDDNPYNNYGFPGNYNPNKGKITPGNPDTYLENYYKKQNKKSYLYNKLTPTYQEYSPDWHWVSGYSYWRNGKLIIVPGHWKTNPNDIGEDNFNCPGNWNPNKGEITPGDREEWLRKYYEKQGQKSYKKESRLFPIQNLYSEPSSQKFYSEGSASAHSYRIRGRTYYRKGQFDLAIKEYNQALALNPNSTYLYNDRGLAYSAVGKLNEAIADYTQAIRLYSGFADGYYNRAMAYLKLGEYDKALQDLHQAKYLFWGHEDKIKAEDIIQKIIAKKLVSAEF